MAGESRTKGREGSIELLDWELKFGRPAQGGKVEPVRFGEIRFDHFTDSTSQHLKQLAANNVNIASGFLTITRGRGGGRVLYTIEFKDARIVGVDAGPMRGNRATETVSLVFNRFQQVYYPAEGKPVVKRFDFKTRRTD